MTPAEVQAALGVSRETVERLETFVDDLLRWNSAINLVGDLDRSTVWRRHILDCGQLMLLDGAGRWIDLGSGAGLPGLVCAAIAAERRPAPSFALVESDERKVAFLRHSAGRLELTVTIHRARIERLRPAPHDVVSARGLAPLDRLLEYAAPFCHHGSVLLLHKGAKVDEELRMARHRWRFRARRLPSLSDPSGTILRLSDLRATA